MSSVRMCDQCAVIFSENEEGWTTFSGTRRVRDENGRMITKEVVQDHCATCSSITFHERPRLPLSGSVGTRNGDHIVKGTD